MQVIMIKRKLIMLGGKIFVHCYAHIIFFMIKDGSSDIQNGVKSFVQVETDRILTSFIRKKDLSRLRTC